MPYLCKRFCFFFQCSVISLPFVLQLLQCKFNMLFVKLLFLAFSIQNGTGIVKYCYRFQTNGIFIFIKMFL